MFLSVNARLSIDYATFYSRTIFVSIFSTVRIASLRSVYTKRVAAAGNLAGLLPQAYIKIPAIVAVR
jgi:hypothetical protein